MDGPFFAFVEDVFSSLGPVRIRKMFGGAGVYADGVMFALLADEKIYLKADDALKNALRAHASSPFVWTPTSGPKKGQSVEMSYWLIPDEALEDVEIAAQWAKKALAVAAAAKTRAPLKKPASRKDKEKKQPRP